MDPQDLLLTAFRATVVYLFVLLLIRLLGKREVGSVTAFDFLVALMMGELVDEAIYGDVTMVKFGVSIGVVALWHFINSWASYKSKRIHDITAAQPTVLVENGQIKREALAKERMNEEELWAELRMQSIDNLEEIKCATLESMGQVSVIKQDWAKELQKGDLEKAQERAVGK